jgi:hypothetical protein
LNKFSRETGQALGEGISNLGKAVGDKVENYNNQKWLAESAPHLTNTWAGLMKEWNQTSSDSSVYDTGIGQKFIQDRINPELEKATSGFDSAPPKVREWGINHINSIRDELTKHVYAEEGNRAKGLIT